MPAVIPFIPLIAAGVSVAGGYFANKSKSTSTPTLAKEYEPMQRQLLDMMTKRLNSSTDLSGYQATGTQDINHAFDLTKQTQDNNLTARGLGTSPVAGAVDATRENARAGQVGRFAASMPLLQRELQGQDLGMAAQLLGQGRGMMSTGQSGGGVGGSMQNLAAMLGYLQASGAFKPKPAGGGTSSYYEPSDTNGWG